jgi:hypothetical protein
VSEAEVKAMKDILAKFKTDVLAELGKNRGLLANYRLG